MIMNKEKMCYRYKVRFERKWKSWQLRTDDCQMPEASLDIVAEDIETAMNIAWQSVTLSPEEYQITLVVQNNGANRDYF